MKLFVAGVVFLVALLIARSIQIAFAAAAPASANSAAQKGDTNRVRYDQTPVVGLHHRVHSSLQTVTNRVNGVQSVVTKTNRFIEVATGLNYFDTNSQQLLPTQTHIEIDGSKGVAKHGPHQAAFYSNLKDADAIDLTAPDGKRFRSHVVGLSYYDAASGKSAMIAEVQNCQGQIVGTNQVVYQNAFDSVLADVRYTYKKSGLEQDIIIRENLPEPELYGLNPNTTRLEVLTEFINPPVPQKKQRLLRKENDANKRAAMVEPDLTDEWLDFGATKIQAGKAFDLQTARQLGQRPVESSGSVPGNAQNTNDLSKISQKPVVVGARSWALPEAPPKNVPVAKRWTKLEGRDFLIEAMEYWAIREQLKRLPARKAVAQGGKKQASHQRELPIRELANNGSRPPIQLASEPYQPAGFLVDYEVIYSTGDDFTFSNGVTYYVSDSVNLNGSTYLESGTVIKYAAGTTINIYGEFSSEGGILTAATDSTVGDTSVSTNALSGYYANPALRFGSSDRGYSIGGLEIRYAAIGVAFDSDGSYQSGVSSGAFRECVLAVAGYSEADISINLWGVLLCHVGTISWNFDDATISVSGDISTDCSGLGSISAPPDDYGNSWTNATTISLNTNTLGHLEAPSDVDCFRVDLSYPALLSAYMDGPYDTDTYGLLLDSSGNTLAENDDYANAGFRVSYVAAAGTYYVKVRHHSGSGVGVYNLHVDAMLFPVTLPMISPNGGSYGGPVTVAMSTSPPGAAIYYTLNGSTPTTGSTLYTAPFEVSSSCTVKAIGVLSGIANSAIASASFTITPPPWASPTLVANPAFSPNGGSHRGSVNVKLATATSGANIYYTTDGSTPTINSAAFPTNGITLNSSAMIKAVAVKAGLENSGISSALFMVSTNPAGGPILNINFAQPPGWCKWGYAATGKSSGDFWNPYYMPYVIDGTVTNLLWSDQSSSGMNLRMQNAPGCWGFTVGDDMYGSYNYSQDGQPITITLTSVPTNTYDLYLYGHAETMYYNGKFDVYVNGSHIGYQATTTNLNWNTIVWEEGRQYVVFRGLQVSGTGQDIKIVVQPASGVPIVNGLQLVPPQDLLDMDSDGLPDAWENDSTNGFGNLTQSGNGDYDGDAVSNLQEYLNGTKPKTAEHRVKIFTPRKNALWP